MKCPVCGNEIDKVLETRTASNGEALRRRRQCQKCGYRFTSYERIEDKPITVIKRNGDIQIFDINKITRSIRTCTVKRNIPQDKINKLVLEIEESLRLQAGTKRELTSSEIGEEVLKHLYHADAVAYVRFASVYRSFDNVDQFIQEIGSLSKQADQINENSEE